AALEQKKVEKKMRGFEIIETKRVARKDNKIYDEKEEIGIVTSGNFSPTLGKSIGYCFVPVEYPLEREIKINIGGKLYQSRLASTRFYKR
ncbi:MAG: glycine cleavage system protein T, partial [Candidatus Heimdallarchaeota archaeon]|nr:glycine cleavage system protein T [Candidatus Heimdallarchaeota archaeon]